MATATQSTCGEYTDDGKAKNIMFSRVDVKMVTL
jgi:hypothetical protein